MVLTVNGPVCVGKAVSLYFAKTEGNLFETSGKVAFPSRGPELTIKHINQIKKYKKSQGSPNFQESGTFWRKSQPLLKTEKTDG